uniref:hypothetical protein n=1 Tax=Rosenbergiella australiborealis TaxID=1544696 RepID=UPI001F4D9EC7
RVSCFPLHLINIRIALNFTNGDWDVRKFIILMLPCVLALSGCNPTNSQLEDRATKSIASGLKDPDSAEFRNVEVRNIKASGLSKSGYVCGEVNAKNAFGAYVGFSRFYIHISADTRFLIPMLGISHGESDAGIVSDNGSLQERIDSLKNYQERCR